MNYNARVAAEEMQEIAAGAIGAGLTIIGVAPTHACYNVTVQNGTDADIVMGWQQNDGILARAPLFNRNGVTWDWQTNKKGRDGDLEWPAGRAVYVRQEDVPTTGKVYVTYFYGEK